MFFSEQAHNPFEKNVYNPSDSHVPRDANCDVCKPLHRYEPVSQETKSFTAANIFLRKLHFFHIAILLTLQNPKKYKPYYQ